MNLDITFFFLSKRFYIGGDEEKMHLSEGFWLPKIRLPMFRFWATKRMDRKDRKQKDWSQEQYFNSYKTLSLTRSLSDEEKTNPPTAAR